MKAFSADVLTVTNNELLKETAYKIVAQDESTIMSILEFEDAELIAENYAQREYLKKILESNELTPIDEISGQGAFFIASICGFLISLIYYIIESIKIDRVNKRAREYWNSHSSYTNYNSYSGNSYSGGGYSNSNSSSSSNSSDSDRESDAGVYFQGNVSQNEGKFTTLNPYIDRTSVKNLKVSLEKFKEVAANSNIELKKFSHPTIDQASGNISAIRDLNDLMQQYNSLVNSFTSGNSSSVSKEIDEIKATNEKVRSKVNSDIDSLRINTTDYTDNADRYLSQRFEWMDGYDHDKGFKFIKLTPVSDLSRMTHMLNRIKYNVEHNPNMFGDKQSEVNNLFATLRKTSIKVAGVIQTANNNYWSYVSQEINQMNTVTKRIANRAKGVDFNEAYYFESATYQNSPELIEEAFGMDTQLSDMDERDLYREFYNDISDTSARFNIFSHTLERQAINQEALLFANAENDQAIYEGLLSINEDVGDKVKKAYFNTIAAIKKIFEKFMEKLTANFTTTKHYLDRYKDIILTKPFDNSQYKSQNLGLGIRRIYDQSKIPTLDLQTMTQSQLTDEVKFFNHYKNALAGDTSEKAKTDDIQDLAGINNWFKNYFCMQGHDFEFTGKQFQQNIKMYYDFLYDIRKIENNIKNSIREMEKGIKNLLKQAGKDVETGDTEGANGPGQGGGQNAQPNTEAAYSYLYEKWFTLNESGVLVEVETIHQDDNGNATGASRVKNVTGQDNSDNNTMQARNNHKNVIDNYCRVYSNVCSGMLKAKMSACEFIRNECMQVIRIHVKRYTGDGGQKNNNQQQNSNQQQQQGQQQNNK